ncbi:class I tRNA ligase family protein [Streptomyces echinatus]|uniref:class I tRNA ligase family protein n=1 Tax=Streptomyces echinatus TaxID=67293 RepID=UPI0037B237F3
MHDFSVSRSHSRARGWGIPVPDDPSQVVYVWWDALGNCVTSLGYGTDDTAYDQWWTTSERRVHLVGKGVARFHAVYWPAMLLSAGLPLPTDFLVHDYVTVDGRKISKSGGTTVDPVALAATHGTDADFAGGLGNLVHRIVTMTHRFRGGIVPTSAPDESSGPALLDVFRRAIRAVWDIVEEANRCVPDAATRITERLTPVEGRLPAAEPLFARLQEDTRPA